MNTSARHRTQTFPYEDEGSSYYSFLEVLGVNHECNVTSLQNILTWTLLGNIQVLNTFIFITPTDINNDITKITVEETGVIGCLMKLFHLHRLCRVEEQDNYD